MVIRKESGIPEVLGLLLGTTMYQFLAPSLAFTTN